MPRAKRNKVVALTKVRKNVQGRKEGLVEKVRHYLDTHKSAWIFSFANMTTNSFKLFKESLPDSKFCLGKNKVMAIALGKGEEDSYKPNSYMLSQDLKGQRGLFFTNKPASEIVDAFNSFEVQEYAQVGAVADRTLILEKGFESLKKFSHSMEPYLRSLGLNVRLMNAQIELLENFMLCEEGKPLSVQKCKLLKLLDIKLGKFKLEPLVMYNTKNGSIKRFAQ